MATWNGYAEVCCLHPSLLACGPESITSLSSVHATKVGLVSTSESKGSIEGNEQMPSITGEGAYMSVLNKGTMNTSYKEI